LGTCVRGATRAALRAHGWFGRPSAVGTHFAGCLPSSSLYGFGAGSLVGALRCSRDTAPRTTIFYLSTALSTTIFYLSTALVLISIHLSS